MPAQPDLPPSYEDLEPGLLAPYLPSGSWIAEAQTALPNTGIAPAGFSRPAFGPTPLDGTRQLFPYTYCDARSPYAIAQADRRARTRFLHNFLTAVAVCALFVCYSGSEFSDYGAFRTAEGWIASVIGWLDSSWQTYSAWGRW